ncbi:MAG: DMT family transporter [Flexilinea sp.]
MKTKNSYHLYAIIAILCWTLAYVYTKLALQYYSPMSIGFLRYLLASILLIIVLIIGKVKPPQKKDFLWFFASGTLGFSLYMVVFNTGMKQVTSATSSILISTAPIFTALLAWILFKENLQAYQWIAVTMEFVGILLLTLIGGNFSSNSGVFLLLFCAVMLAFYNLIQRKLTKTYTALQITSYSILIGTVMLSVFSPTALRELKNAPTDQIVNIIILGIFPSAIAYVSWTQAIAKAKKTSQATIYMFFIPLLSALTGFLIAGEKLELSTILGGTVIIFGMLLFNKDALSKNGQHESFFIDRKR